MLIGENEQHQRCERRSRNAVRGGSGVLPHDFFVILPPFRTVLACFKLTIQNVFIPFFNANHLSLRESNSKFNKHLCIKLFF